MKEHASKCGFENRLEQEIKQQIILRAKNNKLCRYAFKNSTLSLKDLLTYDKSLEEIGNKTEEMERKIQREEEINKVVKKLLGKNRDKSKRNGCRLFSLWMGFSSRRRMPSNRKKLSKM